MKKITMLLCLLISTFTYSGIGSGHSHGHGHSHGAKKPAIKIEQSKAEAIGRKRISSLISKKKIESSWAKAKLGSAKIKDFNGQKEWFLTFKNEKGVKGKKLYIFLKVSGEFIAANFTGK